MSRVEQTYLTGIAMLVGAAVALFIPATVGLGAEDLLKPKRDQGYKLAQAFCKGCHVIDELTLSPVPVGVPSFRAIANRLGQTGEKIKDVLIKPHAPMPEMQLSNDEILSLIAYMESLRTNNVVPPLIAPSGTKPTLPTPS